MAILGFILDNMLAAGTTKPMMTIIRRIPQNEFGAMSGVLAEIYDIVK